MISISQSLNHHKSVVSWTHVLIVRSTSNRMPDAVDRERIVEIHTIASHDTCPVCDPQRFSPKKIRHEHRNQNDENKKRFSKVSVLEHDRLISSKITDVNRLQRFLAFRSVLHADPADVRKKSSTPDVMRI